MLLGLCCWGYVVRVVLQKSNCILGVEFVRNWVFFSLFIILLVCSVAFAEVESSVIQNQISFGKEATYKFTVRNSADATQQYTVFSLQSGQGWNVAAAPLSDRVFTLLPGQTKILTVVARPVKQLPVGIYFLPVSVMGDKGDDYSESLKVYLGKEVLEVYAPSIAVTVDMNDRITPGEAQSVKLFLENKNRLDLSGLVVTMSGELAEFNHEITVDLPSLASKTVEFTVGTDKYTQPREYDITFNFEHQGKIAKTMSQKVSIVTVLSPFVVSEESQTVFGRRVGSLSIRNEGNVRNEQQVLFPISEIESFLIESDTAIVESDDGSENLAFTLSLSPQESLIVNYVINYRWLMYVFVALVLIFGFVWFARSPVRVIKKATTLQMDEEGALAELKITLEVENKTDHPIRHITVTDTVPGIVSVEKISELGTLRPIDVRHQGGKTKIVWLVAELDAREDRLITYKVRSKLNILGALSLPRAQCEFKARKGLRRKAYSNSFTLR